MAKRRPNFKRSVFNTRNEQEKALEIHLVEDIRRYLPGANEAIVVNWPNEQNLE